MAGTTTNYSLPYPEPTDLVADYPALGQDLAEDLDTILAAKGDVAGETWTGTHDFTGATVTGAGGLVHLHTETFSAVSGVSINNVFSSNYDDYVLVLTGYASTSTNSIDIRLRASGTDDTSNNYSWEYLSASSTTVAAGSTTQNKYTVLSLGTTKHATVATIFGPNIADRTIFTSNQFTRNAPSIAFTYAQHTVSTAYDGLSLLAATGTITGTARIYGYQNA